LRQGTDPAQLEPLVLALEQPMGELLQALHAHLAADAARVDDPTRPRESLIGR